MVTKSKHFVANKKSQIIMKKAKLTQEGSGVQPRTTQCRQVKT